MDLAAKALNGDRRALARIITKVESSPKTAPGLLATLYPKTGNAHIIGVTGPPGCGKSTLVNRLAAAFRKQDKTVGIIAVDPTSPFTGGALLGDRIRMLDLATDPGVFIRSMGTRGCLGGLSRAATDVIKVLDAVGMDIVIVETVGAGQAEVDVVRNVHTTILVTVPDLGDDIQAFKAGIMEIGDIFVVNKADRDGVEKTVLEIKGMLDLGQARQAPWMPPVLRTIASKNLGTEELIAAIMEHRKELGETGELEQRERAMCSAYLLEALEHGFRARLEKETIAGFFESFVDELLKRKTDPYTAADAILERLGLKR